MSDMKWEFMKKLTKTEIRDLFDYCPECGQLCYVAMVGIPIIGRITNYLLCLSCKKVFVEQEGFQKSKVGKLIGMTDDQPIIAFPLKCAKCGTEVKKRGKCPGCGLSY